MPHRRPGIFVRLGNIIVFQVLFIFGALALILFYPDQDGSSERVQNRLHQRLTHVARVASASLEYAAEDSSGQLSADRVRSMLQREKGVSFAAILDAGSETGPAPVFSYAPGVDDVPDTLFKRFFRGYCDSSAVVFTAAKPAGFVNKIGFGPSNTVYYIRLEGTPEVQSPVLVAAVNHDLLVSSRSNLLYGLLIIFLASTLISLLLVYLISKRFSQPLDRLIRGLEKTAEGELYYMIEAEGDEEFTRLVNAFNRMTQTLWDNQKQLKAYNAQLKRSNASILESQLFLATLIYNSPLAIVVTNSPGQVLIFNRAASAMFGYSADDVVGQSAGMLFSEAPRVRTDSDPAAKDEGLEAICRRQDGESFPVYVVAAKVATSREDRHADLLIIRDISESRNFQDMMVRLDRYYTRGEMAGDIAHEINNYLAVLMGNLELLPMLLAKGKTDRLASKLDIMKATVERIARFANGLMDAPHDDTRPEIASMNQVVENIIAFLKPQNRFDRIKITADLSHEVAMVELDAGQIQQLLVNLIYNASDALSTVEGPRRIVLSTTLEEVEGERMVRVDVRDNGPGVPAERINSLFAERFTTKRKGHGIGLITCRRIIENHRGRLLYRYDDGAVFYFYLPLKQDVRVDEVPSVPTHAADAVKA